MERMFCIPYKSLSHFHHKSLFQRRNQKRLYVCSFHEYNFYLSFKAVQSDIKCFFPLPVGRLINLSGGLMEESCTVDVEPPVEASAPSVQLEALQGDAPDFDILMTKPNAGMSRRSLDVTDGSFEMRGPSAGLPKGKKSTKCLSCAPRGEIDEPYGKGSGKAGIALDRPELALSGRGQANMTDSAPSANADGSGVDFDPRGSNTDIERPDADLHLESQLSPARTRGPHGKLHTPSAKGGLPLKSKNIGNCFSCAGGTKKEEPYRKKKVNADLDIGGPNGSMEMKAGREFDVSGSGPHLAGAESKTKGGKFGAGASSPDLDFDVDGSNLDVEEGGPEVGMDVNAPGVTSPKAKLDPDYPSGKGSKPNGLSKRLNLPSSKKQLENCFTCTGAKDKDEPYGSTRGNAGYASSGPKRDGSFQMKDISKPNISTNGADVDAPDTGVNVNIDTSSGQVGKPKTKAGLGWSSSRRKGGNCFSCAAGAEKDEPYRAKREKAALELESPEFGGSMQPSAVRAALSGPDADTNGTEVNVDNGDFEGPAVDVQGPKFDAKGSKTGISGPDGDGPDVDIATGMSGPKFDAQDANIKTDFSGPDVDPPSGDPRGPKASVGKPSAKLGLPSIKKTRPNCFSCAGGADMDEPYITTKGQPFDIGGPEGDGSKQPGNVSACVSGQGGSGPVLGMNVAKSEGDFSGPDADVRGPTGGVSGPDVDAGQATLDISAGTSGQQSGDLRGPKASLHKPSAELGLPSTKKRRPNCFSCAGGADKDEPYLTAKGQTFDPNGPDVDGSMQPGDISVGASGPGGNVSELGMNVAKPDADFSGPDADIQGPEDGVSGPDFGAGRPSLDISGPDADIRGPTDGVSGPEVDARQQSLDISAGMSGQPSGDIRGPKASLHKPSAELGLPSTKKRRPNCFSCAGGADKDEPYLRAKGQTYDPNGPDFDGSMKPGDISAGASGPEGKTPGLKVNVVKPDAELSGPDADIQGQEAGVSGPDFDDGQAGLDISAGMSGQQSGDLRGPKASLHKPSAELGLPSTKKRRPNCFSCAGGADKDEPYLTAKGQTYDPNGPDVDGSMQPGDISAGASGPGGKAPGLRMNVAKPDAELSGPDADIQGQEAGVSGPDVDARQQSLDISAGMSGQPSGDLQGPKASLHKPSAELGLPSTKKRRPNCFSCAGGADKDEPYLTGKGQTFDPNGPDVDGSMQPGDISAGAAGLGGKVPGLRMNVAKPDADLSGPDADIQGPGVGVSGPDFDAGKPRLDISGPEADIRGPTGGVSGPDVDAGQARLDISAGTSGQQSGDIRGPKASLHKPSAELGLPSTKKRRPNCFSCAGGADKDEPYLTAKGQTYDPNGPDVDGSMQPGDISAGASGPGGKAPGLRMNVAKPDADLSGPDADIQGPEISVSGPDLDAGQQSLDISAGMSGQPSGDLRGPKASLHKPSAELDLPSTKKRRPTCFSCAGDAGIDEPYITTKGQTFDPNGPDVDGSMQPGDISAGFSGPGGKAPGLGMNVAKPDADFAGPDVDTQEPEGSISGPDFDASKPNFGISAGTSGPRFGIQGSSLDYENGGQLEMETGKLKASADANLPEVNAPGANIETDFSGPELASPSGDLQGPKASLHKPSTDLGLPSTKKKRPNCFSCAGGADKDEPYFTAKGQTFDPNGPDVEGSMHPGNVNVTKPDADFPGPDADIRGPKGGVSGPEFDAGQPNLDISTGTSGPRFDIQSSKTAERPKAAVDVNLPEVDAPTASIKTDSPGLDFDSPSGKLRGPKATSHKPSAGLGFPSLKQRTPNCFSCARGADKDEPYITSKGKAKLDWEGNSLDGSLQPGEIGASVPEPEIEAVGPKIDVPKPGFEIDELDTDLSGPNVDIRGPKSGFSGRDVEVTGPSLDISARSSEPGLDIRGSKPLVDVEGDVEVSTMQPVEATSANFSEMDTPDVGMNVGLSGPDLDSSAGKLQGPKVASDKPSANLGVPSWKKNRANCFSCTGGAEKDDPYITAKGGSTFDLNGPEVDGSMQPSTISADVSGPQVSAGGLEKDVAKPDFEINPSSSGFSGPVVGVRGPQLDVQGAKTGISGPEVDANGPNVDIPSGMSGPEFDFGGSKSMAVNGGDIEISAREADLPEIDRPKASIEADFSTPDGDATASSFHKSKLGLPSAKKNIPSCFSCAGGADKDDPYLTTKGKTTFNLSHEADGSVQPGNINTPGLRMNVDKPNADFSGPHVDIRGPKGSVSGPDDDNKRPNLDISAGMTGPGLDIKDSQPSVDNGGELERVAERPKASVSTNVPEVDASGASIKTDFSGPDFDSPSGDPKGLNASAHKPSAELGLHSIKKKRPNCFSCAGGADRDEPYITTKGETSFDLSGPEVDGSIHPGDINTKMDVPEGDMTRFDVEANVPRARVPSADLDVSHVEAGMSEPEPPQFEISGPGASISGSNIDVKGPKIDVGETDLGATGGDAKLSKVDLDVSGPTGKPNVGLDARVETPGGKLAAKPSLDVPKGKIKDPKATADMTTAELSMPSGKIKGGNCFSCATSPDKDEPYRKTKEKSPFSIQGPDADVGGQRDISDTLPSIDGGKNLDAEGDVPGIDLTTGGSIDGLDASISKPKDLEETDIPSGNIKSPSASGRFPSRKKMRANCLSCGPDAEIDVPYGKRSGSIDLEGPKIDSSLNLKEGEVPEFEATSPNVDLSSDLDLQTTQFDLSKGEEKLEVELNKPSFQIKSLDMPGASVGTEDTKLDTGGPGLDIDTSLGILGPKGMIDLDFNLPDADVSATKPSVDKKEFGINAGTPHFGTREPDFDVSGKKPAMSGLGNIKGPGLDFPNLDVSVPKTSLDIDGSDMDKTEFPKGGIDYDVSMPNISGKQFEIKQSIDGSLDIEANHPDVNVQGRKPRLAMQETDMDPTDLNFDLNINPEGKASFKPGGSTFDTKFDGSLKNLTPKLRGPDTTLDLETRPLDGDIVVANDINLELQSTPEPFPSLDYQEPPSLQRHKIHSDMDLNVTPTPIEKPFSSDFNTSLDTDGSPSTTKTLTLNPEISQKVEFEFHEGKASKGKRDSSSSSSSSSSSESDSSTEDKPKNEKKKKKKSRLFKVFGKGSASLASPKEGGDETKTKRKDSKSSTSSSSSSDGKRDKEAPSINYGLSGNVTGEVPEVKNKEESPKIMESSFSLPETAFSGGVELKGESKVPDLKDTKFTDIPKSDVSLDADASFNLSLQDKVKEAKEGSSSSSSSSSDEEDNAEVDKEKKTKPKKKKKKKWSLFGLLRKDSTSSESSKNDATEQKDKEKESSSTSSSSSSDEDERKKKQQKDDTEHSKSGHGEHGPVSYKLQHSGIQTKYLVTAEKTESDQLRAGISSDLPAIETTNKEHQTSADERVPKKFESSNSSMLYQVEYLTNQQKYIIETPEEMAKHASDVADYEGDGAQIPAVESRHPETFNKSMKDASGGKPQSLSLDSRPSFHTRFTTAQEPSIVVVSRSLRNTDPQSFGWTIDDHPEAQDANIQQTEPPVEGAYHLEYPHKAPLVKSTGDNQVQEDHITPTAKLKPNISFEGELHDKATEGEEGQTEFSYAGENRFAPTSDLKPYFVQTDYHITAPEKPVIDVDSSEIQEDLPTVVRRFTKEISDTDVDQGESGQFVAITTSVVSSEPSTGFELEYPGADNMFTTDSRAAWRTTDEEWIVANSFQKEKPHIPGLKASLDQPEEKPPPRTGSSRNEDNKATSPSEQSSINIPRRGSNSRLWELMQGYLIETPVLDDDETETPSEKADERKTGKKFEDENSEAKLERTVFNVSLKSSKFETVHVPVQFDDKEDITSVSRTDVASEVKVESEGAVGGKKPDAGYRTEYSLQVSKDDDQDDPWMRHYSKGLQSRGLSFSKVPHVKEIKPTADVKTTTTTRHTSEKRFQTETVSFQIGKEKSQTSKSNEDLEKPFVKGLRSFWDN